MLDGERRFCGQHCVGTGQRRRLALRGRGGTGMSMCVRRTQAGLIKHCHFDGGDG